MSELLIKYMNTTLYLSYEGQKITSKTEVNFSSTEFRLYALSKYLGRKSTGNFLPIYDRSSMFYPLLFLRIIT